MRNPQTIAQTSRAGRAPWYKIGAYDFGMHVFYAGALAMMSSSLFMYRLSLVLSALGSIILIAAALGSLLRRWAHVRIPVSVVVAAAIMPLAVAVMLIGMAQNPETYYYKAATFLPYFLVLAALGGVDEQEWTKLRRAFRIHALIGIAVFAGVLAMGYSWEYESRGSFFAESTAMGGVTAAQSPLFRSWYLFYSVPVLLLCLPEERLFWRIVAVAGTLGMAAWAILGQFRSALILDVGLTVVFSIFVWYRTRTVRWSRKFFALVLLAACALGGWQFMQYGTSTGASVLEKAFTQLYGRLSGEKGDVEVTRFWEDVRFSDAAHYVLGLTPLQLLMGDSGAWTGPSGVGMHVGYLMCVIIGGLPTLLVVCLLVPWQGWWGMILSRRLSVLAAASVVAMFSMQAVPFGVLTMVPSSALLFLCAGYCWRSVAAERALRGRYRALHVVG